MSFSFNKHTIKLTSKLPENGKSILSSGVGSGDVGSGGRKIDMFVSDVSARGSVSDIMNKRCKRRVKIEPFRRLERMSEK